MNFQHLLLILYFQIISMSSVKPVMSSGSLGEFWETAFVDKKEMWGLDPSPSAVLANDFFIETSINDILIPGIGYGRNAQIFKENGISVTGIEISKTAIEMARTHYGNDMIIHHGSVTEMPFDSKLYGGVFCYGLIHLLDASDRAKLISDCYAQLAENGYMLFVTISKDAPLFGQGTLIEKDRYETNYGVKLFFYDRESIEVEFGAVGLIEVTEIMENFPFLVIKCKKRC